MNPRQLKRTICMDLRRAVHLLPATAIYTLIFLLASLLVIKNGEKLFFNPNQTVQVPVGLYMPMDDERNKEGFALVENMQSFRETLEIINYDSEEAGMQALSAKTITALIIIPDDFVSSIYNDINRPVRIIFEENDTLEEHIVNDLLLNSAQLLGTAQATEYTIRKVCGFFNVDKEKEDRLASDVNGKSLSYVLTRDILFETSQFDELSHLPLTKQLASCYTLLVLLLLSFLLTPFYQGKRMSYIIRQHAAGLSKFGIRVSEWISTVLLLMFSYIIIFAGLLIAGIGVKWTSLILMIPIMMVVAVFIHCLSYSVKSSVYANLVILIAIVLLLYLSGGLIPIDLLPKFLQKISSYNPVYGLIRLMQGIMF